MFDVQKMRLIPLPLLQWYDQNKRAMAWRDEVSPYRTWVSEIMLQQTRVEAVHGYFDRFMKALPDIPALAAADEETLYKLWEGLGYYSRVRNLKKAAEIVVRDFGGLLPSDVKILQTLPGIGAYTAGAIASIAYGVPAAAVDGNVIRVFARFLNIHTDFSDNKGKKALGQAIEQIIPNDKCSDFTQALMELGALVCIPANPRCALCPLADHCAGKEQAASLPVLPPKKEKKAEKMTVCYLRDASGRLLLRKRPDTGLLAGLWEPWHTEGHLTEVESKKALQRYGVRDMRPIGSYTHVFTHIKWLMRGFTATVARPPEGFLPAEDKAMPRAFAALLGKGETSETN